jgi:hypothetical protein
MSGMFSYNTVLVSHFVTPKINMSKFLYLD